MCVFFKMHTVVCGRMLELGVMLAIAISVAYVRDGYDGRVVCWVMLGVLGVLGDHSSSSALRWQLSVKLRHVPRCPYCSPDCEPGYRCWWLPAAVATRIRIGICVC